MYNTILGKGGPMKITDVFAEAQSYETLCALAEEMEPKLSFFGKEYLCTPKYQGYLEPDDITARLFELLKNNLEFNELNRTYGKKISCRINVIYEKSDEILKAANFFTKLLVFLRGICCSNFARDEWILNEKRATFEYYTRSQFNRAFGYSPEEAESRGIRLSEAKGLQHRWRIMPNPAN